MKYSVIVFLCFYGLSLTAQTHSVVYHATLKIMKPKSQSGQNTLLFDGQKSLYIHDEYPTSNDYIEKTRSVVFIKGDSEGLPIYRDIARDEMVWKEDYSHPKSSFIWTDSIPHIEWTLIDSTKQVSQYTCRKAGGNYGGRTYVAWYTPQIPVPLGPYKFGGLPGLILEIYSFDGRVRYDFVSHTYPYTGERKIQAPTDGTVMDSTKYYPYMKKRLESAERFRATHNDPPKNWDIEYYKHRMYARIKEDRGY